MARYDVVLIHPPSLYDFRKKIWFPGPIDRTVPNYTAVFLMFPIGLISIGSYLQEHGIRTKVVNIAEKMVIDRDLDIERFLQELESQIYGIDLHWSVHSQGAVKITEICKKHHPDSTVVVGGLTATCFDGEIVSEFRSIDCVVRGEAEEPLLQLAENIGKTDDFRRTPNLTFLDKRGRVVRNRSLKPVESLDHYDFTRLDIVEPNMRTLTSPYTGSRLWNLPICRGCVFDCATCGGSNYSYRKLLNREKPAFRSPQKLHEDLMILDEQGVSQVFLFQDPRIGGDKYVKQILDILKGSRWSSIKSIGMELFTPADRSFIKSIVEARIADYVGLSISPESGTEYTRRMHGRDYSNDELLSTCEYCRELNIPLGVFFLAGVGYETSETLQQMWKLWNEIFSVEKRIKGRYRIYVDCGPMIFLDPGSLAFDFPERYGYKLRFKNFRDYFQAMDLPHWSQWISYETVNMSGLDLANSILESLDVLLRLKREHGRITEKEYGREKLILDLDKIFVSDFVEIMKLEKPNERNARVKELAEIAKDPLLSLSYIQTQGK
ncbi:MAG: cobalamin-dependent protein [Candidatus Bathyarchaeia archaeon]